MIKTVEEVLVLDFKNDDGQLLILKIWENGDTELCGVSASEGYRPPEDGTIKLSLMVSNELAPKDMLERLTDRAEPGHDTHTFKDIGVMTIVGSPDTPTSFAYKIAHSPEEAAELYDHIMSDYRAQRMKKAS